MKVTVKEVHVGDVMATSKGNGEVYAVAVITGRKTVEQYVRIDVPNDVYVYCTVENGEWVETPSSRFLVEMLDVDTYADEGDGIC